MLYFQPDILPKLSGKANFDSRTLFQVILKHEAIQENPYTLYVLADAKSQAGNKTEADELFNRVADLNWILTSDRPEISENSLNYALVRSKAMMAVKKQMAGKN